MGGGGPQFISCYSINGYFASCLPRILCYLYLNAWTADFVIVVLKLSLRHHDVFLSFFISDGRF